LNRRAWALGLLLASPALAWAHSPVPGLGRFYSGMLHPVLAPAALIALVALGLLFGQRGLVHSRGPVLAFVLTVALGLVAGSEWPGLQADPALLLLGLASAGCALAAWRMPPRALLWLAACSGTAAGLGLADMAVGAGRWVVIAGTWLGAALLALGVAAVAELGHQAWQRIAARVVASWLAASALLVLGLQWAGPLPVAARPLPSSPAQTPAPTTSAPTPATPALPPLPAGGATRTAAEYA
jgi:urease accessory protein